MILVQALAQVIDADEMPPSPRGIKEHLQPYFISRTAWDLHQPGAQLPEEPAEARQAA